MYGNRYVKQATLLILGCGGFLVGLSLARRLNFAHLELSFVGLGLSLATWPQRGRLTALSIIGLGLTFGLWRGQAYMSRLADYQVLFRRQITVSAYADNDAIYGKQSQLSFDVVHVSLLQPYQLKLAGRVKVEGLGTSMVYRGDQLQIQGSLAPTKGAAQAKFSFAKITLVRRSNSWLDNCRRRFIAALESVLPEPQAPFAAGLLLGQRSTIPKATNDQLSATGLTHLVAVSGYNLTIIIMAVRRVLHKNSKFQSTTVAALLMFLFVLLTGLSASIVRATLVSSLSLVAWYYGRQFKPLLLIALTAAITTFLNPFYLWSDIGWYLSYLAFFGVLIVAPLVSQLLSRGKQPKVIGALLAETISAQIMTLPIIMYIFGRVSVIGLVANILIVPLVPLAMLLTLIAGVAGMLSPVVAGWLAWPARLLLTYMIDLVGLLSQLPHAAVQQLISLNWMLAAYATILLVSLGLWRWLTSRNRVEHDNITE